jgi:multiple sugar transport system substrate-binding protein
MRKICILSLVVAFIFTAFVMFAGSEKPKEAAVEEKAPEVTEMPKYDLSYFEKANIDWRQFEGETISILAFTNPFWQWAGETIPQFEELTGIKTKILVLSESEFFDKQMIALTSGSGEYDLTYLFSPYFVWQYEPGNHLADLNQFINDPKLTDPQWYKVDDYYPAMLQMGKVHGKQLTMPYQVETCILHYRKDLFDKAGIKEPPKTLEELYKVAKRMTDEYGVYGFDNRGALSVGPMMTPFTGLFYAYGAKDFDEKTLKSLINSPESVYVMSLYAKIIRECGPPDWTTRYWYERNADLQAGKTAMTTDCDLFVPVFEDPEQSSVAGELGYSVGPGGPKGIKSSAGGFGWGIDNASKNKKAAWLFIEWATSPRVLHEASVKGTNMVPIRKSVWESPELIARMGKWDGFRDAVTQNLEKYAGVLDIPNPKNMAARLRKMEALQEIWMGKDPQEALDRAVKDINDMMREAGLLKE